jgi:hypothetical protein
MRARAAVTVQKTCEYSKNEEEVKNTLNKLWNQPDKAKEYLSQLSTRNLDLFNFEKSLESLHS